MLSTNNYSVPSRVTVFPTNVRSVTLKIVVFFKSTAILQT